MQRLVNNKKLVDQVLTRFLRFVWSGGDFSSSNDLGSYFTSIEKKRGNGGHKVTMKRLQLDDLIE